MKKNTFLILAMLVCLTNFASAQKSKNQNKKIQEPKTTLEITSYALGTNLAKTLQNDITNYGIDIDWQWVINGLKEEANGIGQFDDNKMKLAFGMLDSIVNENNLKKAKVQKDFLELNKQRPGVITTESGLQYEVIKMGEGKKPTANDQVTVHYVGKTIDGKIFDSSRQRGEATTFPLSGVIKGWLEGIQLMPVGSQFTFYIPSELAYGERGAGGGAIPPYATLIFEVELIDIPAQTEIGNKSVIKGF